MKMKPVNAQQILVPIQILLLENHTYTGKRGERENN